MTRFAEHQRFFADKGIDIEVELLRTVDGKSLAKTVESRYNNTYNRVFGQRPRTIVQITRFSIWNFD